MATIYGRDIGATVGAVRSNPTRDLHAFHVGHRKDGAPMYVVADSRPGHRHDEFARMPSGRRALIVQHGDLYNVAVSYPGTFATEHARQVRGLAAAVAFAKQYG